MKRFIYLLAPLLVSFILSCGGQDSTTYSVTYDGNGNTGGTAPVDTSEYTEGSSVTILGAGNLTRTDYTFTGWNTESDGSGTNYAIGTTLVMGNSNVVLYAKWTQNPTYTVTYDGNGSTGGDVPTDSNHYEENDNVTVLGVGTLVKAGYEFNSWNTESDGSGTSYNESDTFIIGAADVTLFAIWDQVYALRDTGPAGGLIFYINPNYVIDGWRYMEAAPASTEWTNKQWGTSGTLVGGTSTAIGDGPNNTSLVVAAIIAGGGSLDRAAILCNDLSEGGYSDWFLPSQGELNEMYVELYLHAVGGFTNIGYWTSSEFSDVNSWRQTFNTGAQTNNAKTTGYYVRAVRRF